MSSCLTAMNASGEWGSRTTTTNEVSAPDLSDKGPQERVDFFAWARAHHTAFAGRTTSENPGDSYHHDDSQTYFIKDAPTHDFRMFELGWTTAVREALLAIDKAQSLAP